MCFYAIFLEPLVQEKPRSCIFYLLILNRRGIIGKEFQEAYTPTIENYSVVNSVEFRGIEKDLVMQEYGPQFDAEILQNKSKMQACDVACFLYDSGDANSFQYVADLQSRFNQQLGSVACVFVATKSDLDLVPQRCELQPDVYCRKLGLSVPISVSLSKNLTANIYRNLVGLAMDPKVAMTGKRFKSKTGVLTITAVSVGVAVVAAILAHRFLHKPSV
jgi:Ras family protein T1